MTIKRSVDVFARLLLACALAASPAWATSPAIDEQTRALASELRCVVCQNLSVADSPSEMAQQMRAVIREQLESGKSPDEVRDYFVSKYGDWVLLAPRTEGVGAVLWVVPYVALLGGLAAGVVLIRRWARRRRPDGSGPEPVGEVAIPIDKAACFFTPVNPDDASARAAVLRERNRLVSELEEIDFDFHSRKLSDVDYRALRRELDTKLAELNRRLEILPETPVTPPPADKQTVRREPKDRDDAQRQRLRRWQLATGAGFLLSFGLIVGILLTQSTRPRLSERDSLTGDFLTGTGGGQTAALLEQGKNAFGRGEWPQAIEAFKKVLSVEPNHPEAHSYMGFILVQAGHADGALLAFDRALETAPNHALALWGKGMVLYREKQNYSEARLVFERLRALLPAGHDREEIDKVLAELSAPGARTKPGAGRLSGTVRLDPKIRDAAKGNFTLFIIARSAGRPAGPPLAVKKIERPVFPLSYSLGPDDVMMRGVPFSGKVDLSARLDRDGNPATREPGDFTGAHAGGPVEVGANNVDIVIHRPEP